MYEATSNLHIICTQNYGPKPKENMQNRPDGEYIFMQKTVYLPHSICVCVCVLYLAMDGKQTNSYLKLLDLLDLKIEKKKNICYVFISFYETMYCFSFFPLDDGFFCCFVFATIVFIISMNRYDSDWFLNTQYIFFPLPLFSLAYCLAVETVKTKYKY